MSIRSFAFASSLILALPACSSRQGSVDLSSADRRVAVEAVNQTETEAIEAAALAAARAARPVDGKAGFLLLTGSDFGAYRKVAALLGGGFVTPDQGVGLPVYAVRAIHTQGGQGVVDVAYSAKGGVMGLAKVQIKSVLTLRGREWEAVGVTDDAAKPALAAKPIAKPAVEPVAKPVVKPAVEPVAKPVVKPAAEPVAKPAAQPVAKPAAEAAAPAAEATMGWWMRNLVVGPYWGEAKEQANRRKAAAIQAARAEETAKAPAVRPGKRYTWFERNILGKKTDKERAAEAR